MKIELVKDATAGGKKAAEYFLAAKQRGVKTFGLATGGTPVTTYAALVAGPIDFSDAVSLNLDEYVGLGANDPQSYAAYMQAHLFEKKPFAASYLPNGLASDPAPATTSWWLQTQSASSCWGSARTATSASTSREPALPAPPTW